MSGGSTIVWAGVEGQVSSETLDAATMAYLAFALPLLPVLVPLAVLLLEPQGARLRVAPFVVLGAAVSAFLAVALVRGRSRSSPTTTPSSTSSPWTRAWSGRPCTWWP